MRLAGVAIVVATLSSGGTARAQTTRDSTSAFDVLHYDLMLDVPDSGRSIRATATLTVRRTRRASVLPLDFVGMHETLVEVGDGRANRTRKPAAYMRDAHTLRITLPPWRGREDTLAVTVAYAGTPETGLLISPDSARRRSVIGDNWPDNARGWIPSVDRPDDKATVRWTVRAPAGLQVVANGRWLGERPVPNEASGDTTRSRYLETVWEETRPIPTYLMVVAVSPFTRLDLASCNDRTPATASCIPQAVMVAPEVRDFLPGPFARAPGMVAYFTSLVGPFPYEKLWHVQSSTQFGGMENASAIFYADKPFRDRTMREGVIAHETAHQWFGDAVTERTFGDLWLSEGFATYFAALWAGHAHGDSAFRAAMRDSRADIVGSPITRTRPVRDTAQTEYMQLLNTNSYQKGGWVLHMLRGEIGDSAFFRGMRAYYAAHRDGNATSDDLRAAMQRSSGRDLRPFFDQWLTRPGVPSFTLVRSGVANAAGNATYDVRQTTSRPYAFRLTVAERAGGRRATVRVPAKRVARVTLPSGALDIDPDVELLWAAP